MINSYFLNRYELCSIVMQSEKTRDGFFWCPRFRDIAFEGGYQSDSKFYFNREDFIDKVYFSAEELKNFVSTKKTIFDINYMKDKAFRFIQTNSDVLALGVKDKVFSNIYTVEDIVDCFEFKYSIFD